MNLSNLTPQKGSVKTRKRIGRGQGSGRGGTSTKGHKGAQSRSGYKRKSGFEGGQMPLQRRVPKFGFKNPNKTVFKPINLQTLADLVDKSGTSEITPELLRSNGLVGKKDRIKILGDGELTAKISVKADAFSKAAVAKIEQAGGTVEAI